MNNCVSDEWMVVLLKRGARWGDLAVFNLEENLEILTKPSKKSPPDLVSIIETVVRKPPIGPSTKKNAFLEKLAQYACQKKTSSMVQCTTCSFARNTNPSGHFTEEQKSHCCILCSMTGGQKHGGHCQGISM